MCAGILTLVLCKSSKYSLVFLRFRFILIYASMDGYIVECVLRVFPFVQSVEEGIGFPRTEIPGCCEALDMDARD